MKKFDPSELLDSAYRPMVEDGETFDFQMSLDHPAEMNWADPFRPDDVTPEHVKAAMTECLNTVGAHYTYPTGDPALVDEIVKKLRRVNGLDVMAKNITVSCGSDNLFAFAMRPFLTPGEEYEVMMPVPSYAHNFSVPPLIGGKSVMVPTYPEDNYDLHIDEFEKRVTPKTRIVVITNPNNPTSTVYSRATLEKLADFVIRHNLMLIVDQAFEDTVYDGHEMVTAASLPGMWDRTITLFSMSKGMAMCGFRVAYIVACEKITRVFQATSVLFLGAPNTIAQAGAVAALRDPSFALGYRREFMERASAIDCILKEVPHISYSFPESMFILWIDISWYGPDDEVVRYIAEKANVLVSGGGMCGDPTHIRLIFGVFKDREKCLDAVRALRQALLDHPKNQE